MQGEHLLAAAAKAAQTAPKSFVVQGTKKENKKRTRIIHPCASLISNVTVKCENRWKTTSRTKKREGKRRKKRGEKGS